MRVVGLVLLAACEGPVDTDDTDDTDAPVDTDAVLAAAMAGDLWNDLAGHETWGRPATWSDAPVWSEVHEAFLVRYDHVVLREWSGGGRAPEGSISVVDQYDSETGVTSTGVSAMWKVAGYNSGASDWFWVRYAPDGALREAGRLQACATCHRTAPADYVFPEPPSGG